MQPSLWCSQLEHWESATHFSNKWTVSDKRAKIGTCSNPLVHSVLMAHQPVLYCCCVSLASCFSSFMLFLVRWKLLIAWEGLGRLFYSVSTGFVLCYSELALYVSHPYFLTNGYSDPSYSVCRFWCLMMKPRCSSEAVDNWVGLWGQCLDLGWISELNAFIPCWCSSCRDQIFQEHVGGWQ